MTDTQGTQLSLKDRMAALKDTNPDLKVGAAGQGAPNTGTNKPDTKVTPVVQTQVQETVEKVYNVYYNSVGSCKMVTEAGRTIAFVGGKYVTDIEEEINYLNKELALGNSKLSVVPGQEQMTAEDLDPMAALKKQHIAEYLAEQEAQAGNLKAGTLKESTSEVEKIVPGSTADIANLAEQ